MLYYIYDNLTGEFEGCPTVISDWHNSYYGWTLTNHECLKTVGCENFEEESVLNVIWALPEEPEHWKNVKLILIYSKHLSTFAEIQSYLN